MPWRIMFLQLVLCQFAIADEALDARLSRLQQPLDRINLALTRREDADFAQLVDWRKLGDEVLQLGADYPTLDDFPLRNLVGLLLKRADRYRPDFSAVLRQEMLLNPNQAMRRLAAAQAALKDLEQQPLEMRFTALDGREVDLAQMRGKVVLLDFWAATWCAACKVELPRLKAAYKKYHSLGFEVIGIACERSEADRAYLEKYVAENEMPWPQYFDGRAMRNPFAERFGFIGIPQYLLLDRNGLLVSHTSSSDGLKNLERMLERLLLEK